MIIYYEYDKDYHYDLDDRVDNIWLRANGGGESVLCLCADSKVREGVAEPRSKHQNFHTHSTQIHHLIIIIILNHHHCLWDFEKLGHKNSLNTQIMTIL